MSAARYTEENANVRTIPAGEIWVGIILKPRPYIAIASRRHDDDEVVLVCQFGPVQARGMASELIRLAAELAAPLN